MLSYNPYPHPLSINHFDETRDSSSFLLVLVCYQIGSGVDIWVNNAWYCLITCFCIECKFEKSTFLGLSPLFYLFTISTLIELIIFFLSSFNWPYFFAETYTPFFSLFALICAVPIILVSRHVSGAISTTQFTTNFRLTLCGARRNSNKGHRWGCHQERESEGFSGSAVLIVAFTVR